MTRLSASVPTEKTRRRAYHECLHPLEEDWEEVLRHKIHWRLVRAVLERVEDALLVSGRRGAYSDHVHCIVELLVLLAANRILDLRNRLWPLVREIALPVRTLNRTNPSDLFYGHRHESRDEHIGLHANYLRLTIKVDPYGNEGLLEDGFVFLRDEVLLVSIAIAQAIFQSNRSTLVVIVAPISHQFNAVRKLIISEDGEQAGKESRSLGHLFGHS